MDQKEFLESYFKRLSNMAISRGYDPKRLINSIWTGTDAMVGNNGSQTNEVLFWKVFDQSFGEGSDLIKPMLEEFYEKEFDKVRSVARPNAMARECIEILKKKGYTIALTTNPLFPKIATTHRISWAGLNVNDFAWVTTYENSTYCKPNLNYFNEVLFNIGKCAEDCLLVGNDVEEDLCVSDLGIQTYLLTENVINQNAVDVSHIPQGNFAMLLAYIENLPSLQQAI